MNRTSLLLLVTFATPLEAQRSASYVALQSSFVTSAALDLASTLIVYQRCRPGCYESNPLVPLKAGVVPAMLIAAGLTGATTWAADRVWRHKPLGRKIWWIIPFVGTLNHLLAARSNLSWHP